MIPKSLCNGCGRSAITLLCQVKPARSRRDASESASPPLVSRPEMGRCATREAVDVTRRNGKWQRRVRPREAISVKGQAVLGDGVDGFARTRGKKKPVPGCVPGTDGYRRWMQTGPGQSQRQNSRNRIFFREIRVPDGRNSRRKDWKASWQAKFRYERPERRCLRTGTVSGNEQGSIRERDGARSSACFAPPGTVVCRRNGPRGTDVTSPRPRTNFRSVASIPRLVPLERLIQCLMESP